MSKTDAEWRALDERLAREVMGLLVWDDLTPEEQQGYIDVVPKQFLDMSLERWKGNYWKREYGSVFIDDYSSWRPHQDLGQAMEVRDKIVQQGWDFVLGAALGRELQIFVTAAFAPEAGVGLFESNRSTNTDAKAICAAAERWMDAQKEKQDDPG